MLPMTREWVAKAESDYDGDYEALRSRKKSRRDRICFFSQQCVEKYLKARLTEARVAFPDNRVAQPPSSEPLHKRVLWSTGGSQRQGRRTRPIVSKSISM